MLCLPPQASWLLFSRSGTARSERFAALDTAQREIYVVTLVVPH
jgi:hypothetical protein